MKTIHKFPITITDLQIIQMPQDSQILTIQLQDGIPCIWALVETDSKITNKFIRTYGTGHNMIDFENNTHEYIGSYQLPSLVFHVFNII